MKKIFLLCMVAVMIAWSGTAFATLVSFSMTNQGSDDVTVIKAAVQDVDGGASITVDVSAGPVVGDITGLFFDLASEVDKFTIDSITGYDFRVHEGRIRRAPNQSNIRIGRRVPGFDVGVAVGHLGLRDDIQALTIYVIGSGVEAAAFTRLGVRLQSVGLADGARRGSAKYVGTPGGGTDVFPVPEPATIILMGLGLLGVAAGTKRQLG